MSQHQFFRRSPVPQQVAQQLQTITLPAPTRGIVMSENEAFMQPGAAVVLDNWKPTMRGISLRGGCEEWCQLPEATPVISAFSYADAINHKMFACNATKIYDVSTSIPVEVAAGRTSGNYAASQMANQGGDWLLAVNDAGDPLLRFNGTTWTSLVTTTPAAWSISHAYAIGDRALDIPTHTYWKCLVAHTSPATGDFDDARAAAPLQWGIETAGDGLTWITGPPGTAIENGGALTYVCKYRNRFFFIERNSMNAWYLPLNAVGGALSMIPLSGAATKGGKLLFCAVWSIDAGDGTDDKLIFATDLGEILVFTGSNPADPANWKQEGRYDMSPPLGMNAHILIGGDLLVATIDGILPVSGAITKSRAELELAAVTRTIRQMWREEAIEKREHPWTMCNWHEYGGAFITLPGGAPGKRRCLVVNTETGAFARFTGWDAMCWIRMHDAMFFGTQDGRIMQADQTGTDDGAIYVATMVGGWEVFQSPSQTITWRQARAVFTARSGEPFIPQLTATINYVVTIPPPPPAGFDAGVLDVWDQGLWGPRAPALGGAWLNSQAYAVGNRAYDNVTHNYWECYAAHTSPATGSFADARTDVDSPWFYIDPQPQPAPPSPAERDQYAQWDQAGAPTPVARDTGWVSIGFTGYSHAPIVQVTVSQRARPNVDLISIAATYERAGVNV